MVLLLVVLWVWGNVEAMATTNSPTIEHNDMHGAQGLPDKMSRVFGSKSAMAARLRVCSKSVRFSDTIRTCLREVTIHTIKSLRQTFGAMTRAHRITIGIS